MLKNERGSIFMELAISMPILLMLLTFIVTVGLSFNEWNVISFAAREGARYGAMTHSESNAITRTESIIKSTKGIAPGTSLSNKYTITASQQGNLLTVEIEHQGSLFGGEGLFSVHSAKTYRMGS